MSDGNPLVHTDEGDGSHTDADVGQKMTIRTQVASNDDLCLFFVEGDKVTGELPIKDMDVPTS